MVEDEEYQLQSWCRSNFATLDVVALAKARGLYIGKVDDGEADDDDGEHWLRCPCGDDGHRVRFRPAAQTDGFEYEEREGETLSDRGLSLLSPSWGSPVPETEELTCAHATCRVRDGAAYLAALLDQNVITWDDLTGVHFRGTPRWLPSIYAMDYSEDGDGGAWIWLRRPGPSIQAAFKAAQAKKPYDQRLVERLSAEIGTRVRVQQRIDDIWRDDVRTGKIARAVFSHNVLCKDGCEKQVCRYVAVIAKTRSPDGKAWGKLVQFYDHNGHLQRHLISDHDLQADVQALAARLGRLGLHIEQNAHDEFRALLRAWATSADLPVVTIVEQPGFYGDVFVSALGEVIALGDGAGQKSVQHLLMDNAKLADGEKGGTLESWRTEVRDAVWGNDRLPHLQIGQLAGLAGAVVALTGGESFGIELVDRRSSVGKTTAQMLAAGLTGNPHVGRGLLSTAEATSAAVDALLATGNATSFHLDEADLGSPSELTDRVYRIASSAGRHTDGREATTGSTVWTLSGQQSLRDALAAKGQTMKTGAGVRLLTLDLEKLGAGRIDHEARAWRLKHEAIGKNFGHALPAFMREVGARGYHRDPSKLVAVVEAHAANIVASTPPPPDASWGYRAARGFAVLQASGDLQQASGLIPADVDVAALVRKAWSVFLAGMTTGPTTGTSKVLGALQALCARAEHEGGAVRTEDGALLALVDGDLICIPSVHLAVATGNVDTLRRTVRLLDNLGLLVPTKSAANKTFTDLPTTGKRVNHYRLRRGQLR